MDAVRAKHGVLRLVQGEGNVRARARPLLLSRHQQGWDGVRRDELEPPAVGANHARETEHLRRHLGQGALPGVDVCAPREVPRRLAAVLRRAGRLPARRMGVLLVDVLRDGRLPVLPRHAPLRRRGAGERGARAAVRRLQQQVPHDTARRHGPPQARRRQRHRRAFARRAGRSQVSRAGDARGLPPEPRSGHQHDAARAALLLGPRRRGERLAYGGRGHNGAAAARLLRDGPRRDGARLSRVVGI
mmetsp:Transcript_39281/g.126228  ORF Transcript_39281/g.126228 Transcript_39281/m.126228 type:complete len:245 (-) Transcript_39281:159-893(-)